MSSNVQDGPTSALPVAPAIHSRVGGLGPRAALLCSILVAAGLAFVIVEDTFEPGTSAAAALVAAAAFALVGLLFVGLRDLREAERRSDAALDRLTRAEASEHARADHLARVLEASQGLRLAADGKVDYLTVLATITPPGATSFLVRQGPDVGRVHSAHGPLAPMVMGLELAGDLEPGDHAVRTFGGHGPHAGAAPVSSEHFANFGGVFDGAIESAAAFPLIAHGAQVLGALHMIDPDQDRVLEPSFMALAQLVANQIAVAMENDDLLASLRKQLVEVQRVQQQLIQASRLGAIGELAAAVAHEVNNPLTSILGFAELLLTELPPDDGRRAEVSIIREEAMRARAVVRSLLDFARPHTPQRMDADLSGLARAAVDLVRYRARESEIQIHEDYMTMPALSLDPESFRQVILNLCTNGIEAMPDGGELFVSTLSTEDRVGVAVRDTGVGMDRTTRSRIFSPFLSPRGRNGGYGTALGLSVSLNIVEGHGGTIDVQSEPGRGSCFTVWLPRTSALLADVSVLDATATTPSRVVVAV